MITLITHVEELPYAEVDRLGRAWHRDFKLPGDFKVGMFIDFWRHILSQNVGRIWIATIQDQVRGALGATFCPDQSDGEIVTCENFWFIDNGYRTGALVVRLLREFERWSQAIGARRSVVGELVMNQHPDFKKLLKKLGYEPLEIRHMKIWQQQFQH